MVEVPEVMVEVPEVGTQLFSRMDTLLEPLFAVTRSGRPSPLKSPTATEEGYRPAEKLTAGWKVPLPLPSTMDTLLEPMFPVTRSGRPSPLKSPTATDSGVAPTG